MNAVTFAAWDAPTRSPNQQTSLHRVQVRPILSTERERWNTLMQTYHCRGFRTLAGLNLRFVATLDGRWAGKRPLFYAGRGISGPDGPGSCAASVCISSPISPVF